MGQYHLLVNLDKHEYVMPHRVGDGLKLGEQCGTVYGTCSAAIMLCCCSNGRGGGDFYDGHDDVIGRWAGDRIAWVGDYAVDEDLPEEFHAGSIYSRCIDREQLEYYLQQDPEMEDPRGSGYPLYTDISHLVAPLLEEEGGFTFTGTGWRHRQYPDREAQPVMRPDMIINLGR
jgi:hypothetical protein